MASALNYSQPIVARPTAPHTATVIMLHGLGDSGSGWSEIASEFQPELKHVKFIFPHAPMRAITVNRGMKCPGWYDISSIEDINQDEDEAGLNESKRYIEQLIQAEAAAGISSNRVVVGGFSQGGAMALMMLRSEMKLAGIVGLSCYTPLRNQAPIVSEANKGTPVLMCHGDADMVVNHQFGKASYEQMKQLGIDVEFVSFRNMGHSACPAEMKAFLDFLKVNLK